MFVRSVAFANQQENTYASAAQSRSAPGFMNRAPMSPAGLCCATAAADASPQRAPTVPTVWRHAPSGFHAGLEYRASGKIYVNDQNSAAADAYAMASVRAGFEQCSGRWCVSEFVRVDNIMDRQYVGSVIVADANGRFYEPAPGRNYLVGMSASLAFQEFVAH